MSRASISVQEEIFLIGILKGAGGPLAAAPDRQKLYAQAKVAARQRPPLRDSELSRFDFNHRQHTIRHCQWHYYCAGGKRYDIHGTARRFSLQFQPTVPGPGQITVKALGGPTQTIFVRRSAGSAVTNVSVAGPARADRRWTIGIHRSYRLPITARPSPTYCQLRGLLRQRPIPER